MDSGSNLNQTIDIQKQDPLVEVEHEEISKVFYVSKILTEDMTEIEMWNQLDFFREKFLNQLTD